jgi:hypothetical protein
MHADVFQALADPTRRRIVEALLGGEQAVNDLVDTADIHQSGVSRGPKEKGSRSQTQGERPMTSFQGLGKLTKVLGA